MLYRKETPFDQLSYVALVCLEERTRDNPLDFSGTAYALHEEIVAALKAKAFQKGYILPSGLESK